VTISKPLGNSSLTCHRKQTQNTENWVRFSMELSGLARCDGPEHPAAGDVIRNRQKIAGPVDSGSSRSTNGWMLEFEGSWRTP
jgi:hypothetical protein